MPSSEELLALDRLKTELIDAWNKPFLHAEPEWAGPRLQTLSPSLPPRGGLAIGHGVDPATGAVQLELRVTASAGPDLRRAETIAAQARLQGIGAVIRTFLERPKLPGGRPAPTANPPVFGGRREPLHLGASVAHERGFAGTVGGFVTWGEGKRGVLSCAHVLAEAPRAQIRKGDPIQQPGQPEAIPVAHRIGSLSPYFSRFIPARADNLDAAVAELDEGVEIHGNTLPDCPDVPAIYRGRPLGSPLTREEVSARTRVVKVGRTSGFTEGTLFAPDVLNFRPELRGRRKITFGRVHEVSWDDGAPPFTEGGDSGSLIVTAEGLRPIGIHFCVVPLADGTHRSYMIPWDRVVETFPIRLI